ncbi:universal stress protein [Niabella ginsengisoli]|uniref:Universal stress protein n=1 Tax=Niabella ginsengisoli TaxID=522298 RepID=A0ABS9SJ03_9BACT|nr:universal stress protein [Niabella ginsengisoli]MCH5598351.1 universal stress protein [Niabella ginsengisoli]
MLFYTTVFPLRKSKSLQKIDIHEKPKILEIAPVGNYTKIAITLDFGSLDEKVINHALSQGTPGCVYFLIHVTESVAAVANYGESVDNETISDKAFLDDYVRQLQEKGYKAEARLGFGNTVDSIAKIINESKAELLVIGAHGHKGIKDLIYGETINNVRHLISIPVFVVQTHH